MALGGRESGKMSRDRPLRFAVAALALCVSLLLPPALVAQQQVTIEAGRGVPEAMRLQFAKAIAVALDIMDGRLGLGLQGSTVRYVLVADKAALTEWYQSQLGYTRERAEASSWPTGRALRDRTDNFVLTRLDGFGRAGPDQASTLRHVTHELTHVAQGIVKRCPAAVPSWVTEGWAEWAGLTAVDLEGLRPYAQLRADRIAVMRAAFDRTLFPTLVQLTRAEWERLAQARGSSATYGASLLAVERLIDRAGGRESLDAYCLAARTVGRWASFERVFGITEPDYALEFMRFIRELLSQ